MAYGATVLGLNVREGGTAYYAVIANYHEGLVDVLDAVGPLAAPVQWHSGPYHLAAGLPDGRLIAFLTAPGEYPHQVQLSFAYDPQSPFDSVVRPPQPVNNKWEEWTITAAFKLNAGEPELVAQTFDGQGRMLDSAQPLAIPGQLRSVVYLDLSVPGNSIPVLGLVTAVASPRLARVRLGWHVEPLAARHWGNCRLAPVADPADPGSAGGLQ
jgi:hypothetical protein